MFLENLVFDALEPQRLGGFWEVALGSARVTDEPDIVETRLELRGWPILDLCFPAVPDPATARSRLVPVLACAADPGEEAARLVGLGARPLAGAPGDGVLLADPEGNPFQVGANVTAYADSGPLAAFLLDSADADRDAAFWAWLTGWSEDAAGRHADSSRVLRHPDGHGPVLELRPEATTKGAAKNRLHLDVRLEPHEDADDVAAGIVERGGDVLHTSWGDLPWRSYTDPSGNELCVLPAPS
jgi:predicted enzyme related to lactoylglutathione lyase